MGSAYHSRKRHGRARKSQIAPYVANKTAWTWGPHNNLPAVGSMYRKASLEGRANIYVAPSGDMTTVTVNCRYVLTVVGTGTYVGENAYGTPTSSGTIQPTSATASFDTLVPAKLNWGNASTPVWLTIRSTGRFENDVLSILKNAPS